MLMPTISEFIKTLETMRKAYPFTDQARIQMAPNLRNNALELTITEIDKDTNTEVVLTRGIMITLPFSEEEK